MRSWRVRPSRTPTSREQWSQGRTSSADMASTGSGITLPQLYSTASYQQRNLRGIGLSGHDLTGGDFSGQDLTGADLGCSTLTNANFAGAVVNFLQRLWKRIHSSAAPFHGELPAEEFAGHWIKQQRLDRRGLQRAGSHRCGPRWLDADERQPRGGDGHGSQLWFDHMQGFTKEQLYSTASYQQRNLREHWIRLQRPDRLGLQRARSHRCGPLESTLVNSNLSGANLTNANLNMRLTNADLTVPMSWELARDARFNGANLTRANLFGPFERQLAGAVVAGANFGAPQGSATASLRSSSTPRRATSRGICGALD